MVLEVTYAVGLTVTGVTVTDVGKTAMSFGWKFTFDCRGKYQLMLIFQTVGMAE